MSTSEPSGASTVAIDPALGEILRDQTLLILEINAGSFEEARTRQELGSPEERAEIDEQIEVDRVTADGLLQILRACHRRDR